MNFTKERAAAVENIYAQEPPQQQPEFNIPLGYTAPPAHNPDIMSMRWESRGLLYEFKRMLCGKEEVLLPTGEIREISVEDRGLKPLMNEQGANDVIATLRGIISAPVSLSNISDEDARLLEQEQVNAIAEMIADHGIDKYDIQSISKQDVIMSVVRTIVTTQVHRPVSGHESKQSQTTTQEIKQDTQQNVRTSSGFSLPFFGRK